MAKVSTMQWNRTVNVNKMAWHLHAAPIPAANSHRLPAQNFDERIHVQRRAKYALASGFDKTCLRRPLKGLKTSRRASDSSRRDFKIKKLLRPNAEIFQLLRRYQRL